MKKMTPREALYNICVELGPIPKTNRDDNITYKEARLRDSIRPLQNFIDYHDDSAHDIPDSANEYRHFDRRGIEGKDRLDAWKEEAKSVYRNTASGKTKY